MLGTCSAVLGTGAHTLGGGAAPDTAGVIGLAVLVGWLASTLASRVRGPLPILTVLGLAQLAMHGLFSESVTMPAMQHGATMHVAPMLATHTCATVCTALLLAHADTLLRFVLTGLRMLLPLRWRCPPARRGQASPRIGHPAHRTALTVLLTRIHRRRGPPLLC